MTFWWDLSPEIVEKQSCFRPVIKQDMPTYFCRGLEGRSTGRVLAMCGKFVQFLVNVPHLSFQCRLMIVRSLYVSCQRCRWSGKVVKNRDLGS